MLPTIIYSVVGGLILYLVEKKIMKKRQTELFRFHKVSGIVNLCLAVFFLVLYFITPELFSSDVNIGNQFIYICFSVLASYYYILAAPLSIANALTMLKIKSNNKIVLYINILSCLLLILSFPLFLQ